MIMNQNVLFKHEAEKYHTNIRIFNNKNELIEEYKNLDDLSLLNKNIQSKVYSFVAVNMPLLFCINDKYYYSSIIFNDGAILYGPVSPIYAIKLQNNLNFISKKASDLKLQPINIFDFADSTLLINNILNNTEVDFESFLYNNFLDKELNKRIVKKMNDIRYEFNEENRNHDTREKEKRLTDAIENGDINLISNASIENIKGSHGTVSADKLQNDKLLAVVGITIASRATLNVGILSEIVLTLTDTYIQEISKATSSSQIENIVYNCNVHLARLVKEYLNSNTGANKNISDYYSKKAKLYISNHLHNSIRTQDIASELKISPNYLSNLFKQSEGITLTEYILKEKISLAKGMLLYSNANNLEIASTLSFSSQSHFCKVFKKYTNTTPTEYKKNLK